jgi:hypothetical protein
MNGTKSKQTRKQNRQTKVIGIGTSQIVLVIAYLRAENLAMMTGVNIHE